MKHLIIFLMIPLLLFAKMDINLKTDVTRMANIKEELQESNKIGLTNKIPLITENTSGNWQDKDNYRVWKLECKIEGNYGIIVYFDKLVLPQGSSIFAYSADKSFQVGPFYKNNNKSVKTFAFPEIPFNKVIIEAHIPNDKKNEFIAHISKIGTTVIRASKLQLLSSQGFGEASSCYVNVNCSDADGWQDQKRSVVKYTYTSNGEIGTCSGVLINNTNQDDKNYLLSAQHCGQTCTIEELGQAIFYFNYEAPGCENPDDDSGLTGQTVIGCTRIAASGPQNNGSNGFPYGSDFHLFEINEIPDSYNVFYAGWNRNDVSGVKGNGVIIHHPFGDIKKISYWDTFEYSLTSSMDFEAHCVLSPSGRGGAVEPNSSGSPIFDNQKMIVGTISYGSTGCVEDNKYTGVSGGRFWSHWDQNGDDYKLAPFLDPSNSGVMKLQGKSKGAVSVDYEPRKNGEFLGTFQLFSNYPNPFNPTTVISFSLPSSQNVKLEVFNLLGENVATLLNKPMSAGNHKYEFDASNFNSGLYLYRISAGSFVDVKKMMLLK